MATKRKKPGPEKGGDVSWLKKYQFQPGKSGNPSGRPKRRPVSEVYAAILDLEVPENLRILLGLEKGATWAKAMALGIARGAVKGDPRCASEIREAIEGKATQRLELTGADGGPIETSMDLKRLSDSELRKLQDILAKAQVPDAGSSKP